ncbi:NMDA receptor-regulated protein 1-domain-containing protein [Ochromonadaceae sp. CCMP2298]|nr:NMDA receptor-regulated protein 1-domain-containing protein [Ochromonadaceae sp. CCMP2298]
MSETKETKLSLPKKENDLFRSVITCYEQKQYGKGLKIADSVLKKFPNHGETLSMKGLILNCQGEKKKAFELMKAGVAADSRSHVVWHVFGLYHKGDGNFLEAVKCYESALLIDVNNQNILKDLSWLQVQIGDIPGFVESRRTILRFKPTLRGSYVTLAAALYLSGEFQESFDVVEQYRLSCSDKGDPYEEGELHLFQSKCLEALCLYAEALAHLIKVKDFIVDKLSLNVKSAELSLLSGDFESAKKMWLALVASQPENYRLHCGMQAAYLELDPPTSKSMLLLTRLELPSTRMALSAPQRAMLRELYARFGTRGASGKIQLTLFKGEELRAPLDAHLKANLRAAVPSLFHDVCSLPPTALLWAYYLQAHLQELCGDLPQALQSIDTAILHTPTAIDMYGKRARLLKKMGDAVGAAVAMDECRALDLQDRYLNNKATKYLLRADAVTLAQNTIAMFTKHDLEGDPQKTLYELQVSWFEIEAGNAYARSKQWGPALRKYYAVKKHFADYTGAIIVRR